MTCNKMTWICSGLMSTLLKLLSARTRSFLRQRELRGFWYICSLSLYVVQLCLGIGVGTKEVKKEPSALGRMNICTALPRMVPVYMCYSSVIINSTAFTLKSIPVWMINCMVTSALGLKHVMHSIKLRAIKATKFHILISLHLTGIKKRSFEFAELGSKMTE